MTSTKFEKAREALAGLDGRIEHLIQTGEMPGSKAYYKWDYFKCMLLYQASPMDYIFYRMYKKSRVERKNVITWRKHNKVNSKLNDYSANDIKIIGDKAAFNAYMGDLISRDWICSSDSTADELIEFLKSHGVAFYKPVDATMGHGITKLHGDSDEDIQYIVSHFGKEKFLLEEAIVQNHALAELNPYAVNSVRITTIASKDMKTIEALGVSLKLSIDEACVDNLCSGGQVYPVDPELEMVVQAGLTFVDDDYHYIHPISNKLVLGTKLPHVKDAIEAVKLGAKKFPNLRYIGWDVAITEDGFEIIEANTSPGPNLLQCNGHGRYFKVKSYI